MKRRYAILSTGLLVAVALAVVWPRGPRLSAEAFKRACVGMTCGEMTAAIGLPPGNYMSRPKDVWPSLNRRPPLMSPCRYYCWVADDGSVLDAAFDETGRAFHFERYTLHRFDQSYLQRLCTHLGL